MHQLACECTPLEPNTCYAYLLLCTHFGDTCLIARESGAPRGYVAAYRLPQDPESLFVWQIGVHPEARGRGLGSAMLDALLAREALSGVRFIEATIAPSNAASRRLFTSYAERRRLQCEIRPFFGSELFGNGAHEAEDLFRIGPLDPGAANSMQPKETRKP